MAFRSSSTYAEDTAAADIGCAERKACIGVAMVF
jgi:hypothetical protein